MTAPIDWHHVTPRDGYADYVVVGEHLEEKCGPPPVGAESDEYWGAADENGVRHRHVRWWGRDDGQTSVYIDGEQYSDGRVERGISVWLGDHSGITISRSAATDLIVELQEAVANWDQADGWADQ